MSQAKHIDDNASGLLNVDLPGTRCRKRERVREKQKDDELSAYEIQRLERIKRNNAFLIALSLKPPTQHPSASAIRRPRHPPAKRQSGPESRLAPTRASRRLRGQPTEATEELVALPGTWISSLAGAASKPGDVPSSFRHDYGPELSAQEAEEKMEVLKGQIDSRDDAKAGTASYQHCLHRVRTMSDAALARRVRTIERARGAKAKEKMLVFSNVLRARGKTELLEMAEAALDRLVRGCPCRRYNCRS